MLFIQDYFEIFYYLFLSTIDCFVTGSGILHNFVASVIELWENVFNSTKTIMTVFINDLTLHQLPLKVFISKRRDRFQSTLWPAHVKQIGLLEDNISSPEILHFTMCTSTQ